MKSNAKNDIEVAVSMKVSATTHKKLRFAAVDRDCSMNAIIKEAIEIFNEKNAEALKLPDAEKLLTYRGDAKQYEKAREIARKKGLTIRKYFEEAILDFFNNQKGQQEE